jgi:hypothetical protein
MDRTYQRRPSIARVHGPLQYPDGTLVDVIDAGKYVSVSRSNGSKTRRRRNTDSLPIASLLRQGESFGEEAPCLCGSLAKRCYVSVGGRFEPVSCRLEGWKNDNCRSRSRPIHPLQGENRCPERDQPSSKRRECGFKLFVIGLKSCWVMNLDQGDKISRHRDCGFEWVHPIGYPFLARACGRTSRLS